MDSSWCKIFNLASSAIWDLFVSSQTAKSIDTFDNLQRDRDYAIRIDTPVFTADGWVTPDPVVLS